MVRRRDRKGLAGVDKAPCRRPPIHIRRPAPTASCCRSASIRWRMPPITATAPIWCWLTTPDGASLPGDFAASLAGQPAHGHVAIQLAENFEAGGQLAQAAGAGKLQ